jgi:hypothetical protein
LFRPVVFNRGYAYPWGTRRHLRGYVDYTICITCIVYQQLWGYKIEDKLYLGLSEQKRLNTTGLDLLNCSNLRVTQIDLSISLVVDLSLSSFSGVIKQLPKNLLGWHSCYSYIHPFVILPIHLLLVYPSIHTSSQPAIHPCIHLSIHPPVSPSYRLVFSIHDVPGSNLDRLTGYCGYFRVFPQPLSG